MASTGDEGSGQTMLVAAVTRIDERTARMSDEMGRMRDALERVEGRVTDLAAEQVALRAEQARVAAETARAHDRIGALESATAAAAAAAAERGSWRSWLPPAAAGVGGAVAVAQAVSWLKH